MNWTIFMTRQHWWRGAKLTWLSLNYNIFRIKISLNCAELWVNVKWKRCKFVRRQQVCPIRPVRTSGHLDLLRIGRGKRQRLGILRARFNGNGKQDVRTFRHALITSHLSPRNISAKPRHIDQWSVRVCACTFALLFDGVNIIYGMDQTGADTHTGTQEETEKTK